MRLRGWLVYNKEDRERNSSFIAWFLQETEELNIELALILKEELHFGIEDGRLSLRYQGEEVEVPDFAVARNIDDLFRRQLELMGCRVFNNSEAGEICNNKSRTHQYLASLGIPMMDTIFFKRKELEVSRLTWEYPLVVKAAGGRGGSEVFKVENQGELLEAVEKIEDENILIQRLCKNPGKDLRVFVLGGEIIGAILRFSEKSFKANFSLGGKARLYELNKKEKELVHKIISKLSLDFAGIDFIFDEKDNLIFNELEDVVGSRTLSANSDINVVRLYLQYIKDSLSK